MPTRKITAEQTFLLVWRRNGLARSDITAEHLFCPSRKWRLDIAFPSHKLAVEFEGRGRHQTVVGTRNDLEKYNTAVELGWRILRYPVTDIRFVEDWIEQVKRVLCGLPPDEN